MPRILIVKTSSLGDVVHNCPAVADIARHVPGAEIDWVVEESFAEVVAMHRAVRRVIPVAIRRWRGALAFPSTWSELAALRRLLRSEPYDHVIDSQGLLKSALVTRMAHGLRHGFDRESSRERFAAHFYDVRHAVHPGQHAVERSRKLAAAALGYALDDACDYGLNPVAAVPLVVPVPFAVLLTMSSRDDKLWAEEHWRSLGAALAGRKIQCLLPWGTEDERRRCVRIAAAIGGAVVLRHMSLAELASLARKARFVVAVDTGLAHLAAALEVPVVGLYCGSDPALTGLYPNKINLGNSGSPPTVAEALKALERLL